MTKITVFRRDKMYERIVAEGHAGYAEEGKDIVCSAISALLQSIVLYILECQIDLEYNESMLGGLMDIDLRDINLKDNDIFINEVIFSVLLTLENLEEQYPKNIRINYIEL